MKSCFPRFLSLLGFMLFAIPLGVKAGIPVPTEPGKVVYTPDKKLAQGNQPYGEQYDLEIKMPANLIPNVAIPVQLNITPLSQPTSATRNDFVTLSTTTLTVTQPNQSFHVLVSIAVPTGTTAGVYSWMISTSGWPDLPGGVLDDGHVINGDFKAPGSPNTTKPTVVLNSPADGTIYTYTPASGSPLAVPLEFAATVSTGGQPIQGLAAFLDGVPVPFTASGLGTIAAAGTGSIQVTQAGDYVISVNASNSNGTSTASARFHVVVSAPPPTISVSAPLPHSNFAMIAGGGGVAVPVSLSVSSAYGKVTAVDALLDGVSLPLASAGIGTSTNVTASALPVVGTTGNHNLVVMASNAYGDATPVMVPFTVSTVLPPPTCQDLTWLPPISLDKTIKGGSVMPIKFRLSCHDEFVSDTSVVIAIFEVLGDGSTSTPVLHAYGTGSPNPSDYAITGEMYHLNFPTEKGAHYYRIEVYSTEAGASQFIDAKDLFTK